MVDVVVIGERTHLMQTIALEVQRTGYTVLIVPPSDQHTVRDLHPCLVIDTTGDPDADVVVYERSEIELMSSSDPEHSSGSAASAVATAVVDIIERRGCRGRAARTIGVADIELDLAGVRCVVGGRTIDLTPTEFRLLGYLVDNAGIVVSKEQILDRVFDFDGYQPNVVEVHISSLRRKIDFDGGSRIETVRGVGYVIRSPEGSSSLRRLTAS